MNGKLLPALGACCWILGLILFIVGLNLHTSAGSWLNIAGSVIFLIGLGLEGIVFLKRRKSPEKEDQGG